MTGGSGVDGMIHHAAGDQLYQACKAHKEIHRGVRLPTGHSRILLSYNMGPMPYHIINTAGPMYYRREAEECAKQLSSCYKTALSLAALYDLESIGFTAISCGIFGYVSIIHCYMMTSDIILHSQPMMVLKLHFEQLINVLVRYLLLYLFSGMIIFMMLGYKKFKN
jgi:O-acetyl-ADP-ribose deacetylase (regulator of RNase III)